MVFRVFVEKKETAASEAKAMLAEMQTFLGIKNLENIRILNRYDVEGVGEELFEESIHNVFSEPQIDRVYRSYEEADLEGWTVFAVEALPGQFDQRADSAAQCIQIISTGERPAVAYAKLIALKGDLSGEEIENIKSSIINPVETREASMELPSTLKIEYEVPEDVAVLENFNNMGDEELEKFIQELGLAMDMGDIRMCRDYFKSEGRAPTITEIRMIDTYWSDHCRHTTFNTEIDDVEFADEVLEKAYEEYLDTRKALGRTKPVTLMDIGTIAAKALKSQGRLDGLDESEEINACTVKIKAKIDGKDEDWLLLFKNETHNHPTEIEPFGGAATCIGGAIRDPLSGRAYVYTAMRITGAADPLRAVEETMEGKLPQRKIVTSAADGYSSYGNQIGVTTGLVEEIYHDGYAAKHMELGAVIGAAPAENVKREKPAPGDLVLLIGGRTGRDGCGGATGSSKSHDVSSLESCGAEVQKGNAPEERKLQRLFRNGRASRMIKRCNDFGAGGVSVAIGELADGLDINLDVVPKKYDGLDGTELAISESQERMAVVIAEEDRDEFFSLTDEENLEATVVARVTEDPRLVMHWRGRTIVDIRRDFLDYNGAEKHISIKAGKAELPGQTIEGGFVENMRNMAGDLRFCSRQGLSEKFDSTIGAGTVLMPFGGIMQKTPPQVMAQKISVEKSVSTTASLMSFGYDPYVSEASPYHGAYLAVVDSVCKLIAAGGGNEAIYLSFQEYFEKLGRDSEKWGKPFAALLGAFRAQMGLGVAAIGGKDSMSGSFEDIHVPPTLVSFAVTTEETANILSPEFKRGGNSVYLLEPLFNGEGLPDLSSLLDNFEFIKGLTGEGKILSAYALGAGGMAEAAMKMSMGNRVGIAFGKGIETSQLFACGYGSFLLETPEELEVRPGLTLIGTTTGKEELRLGDEAIAINELQKIYEDKLESVYPMNIKTDDIHIPEITYDRGQAATAMPAVRTARPRVLIPAFPGTNCEYDSARAFEAAGAETEIQVIRNLTSEDISRSIEDFAKAMDSSQMFFIPGGFSGGDEPDGSGKFITAFFRNPAVKEAVERLLDERGGLAAGICNGFQALIKLGLIPYGKIVDADENAPTLTLNDIGRHQSKLVRIRIASNLSPWLAGVSPGEIYTVPISHGEGRLIAPDEVLADLAEKGQIATQYVDFEGKPSADIRFNPNGSKLAIEGMTSPDGRVFGKMGHAERIGVDLYKNVPGEYDIKMFESAVMYFK